MSAMPYVVEVSPAAYAQLQSAHKWLQKRTPQHAPEWYNEALDALLSLEDMPDRCPLLYPNDTLRQLLFGNKRHAYCIIFRIRGNTVYVHEFRHAARSG